MSASNPTLLKLQPKPEPLVKAMHTFTLRLEAESKSCHTVRAYRMDLERLAEAATEHYPDLTIDQISPTILDLLLTVRSIAWDSKGKPRSAAAQHRFKAALRSFFAWAEEIGLITDNPARVVKMNRLSRTPPVFLTESEKRRLLKELRGRTSPVAKRDRVIIEIFLGTGIRLQELVDLNLSDLDLDAKHLRIRAKGNIPQVKFLKSNLRTLLRKYLTERRRQGSDECQALFLSNRGRRISARQVAARIKHWLTKARIDKQLGPHGLRHTFATHLYSKTSDILMVKRALGHRHISTTEIYTHLVDEDLEEALELL
jgi:integrase/recombinase XerC